MKDYRKMSFWLEGGAYQENPPLRAAVEADVAIVGGGFTGLSSAFYIKEKYPDKKVVLLESEVIGYGASGRNGGFSMPLLGWDITYLLFVFKERGIRAHRFMLECVRNTRELVEREKLDCDLEYNGLLVLARNNFQMRQLERNLKDYQQAGVNDCEILTGPKFAERLNSSWHVGALYEPDTAILNPAKLAREMKRAIEAKGVKVFERSPAIKFEPGDTVRIETPEGSVRASHAVLALNAFGQRLRVRPYTFAPMYTYIILTEPLSDELYAEVGWRRREGIEDKRQLVHYMRPTADNRILIGGRDAPYFFGNKAEGKQSHAKIFAGLAADLKGMFPMLKNTRVTHRWGGPVALTLWMVPEFGYYQGHKNIAFGMGYCGHGVALSTSAGRLTRELLFNPQADLLQELLFVHNTPGLIPPEPFRYPMVNAIKGGMMWFDRITEFRARGSRPGD
jgi:glycine/D-amino acid oxidase-like deaminating enzyme